jgi:ADP-heptose:LPS heptosyltransferase
MKPWSKSVLLEEPKIFLETPGFESYCSVIASCRNFLCLASGGATLAAALSKPSLVLHGADQKKMFHHSKHHRYQVI